MVKTVILLKDKYQQVKNRYDKMSKVKEEVRLSSKQGY